MQIKIPTPAKVRVGNVKVPISLEFGASKDGANGQLFGLGLTMGREDRQLLRMDYHDWHTGKSIAGGKELAVWRSGNYHYHVNQWNQ